jgi:hypothetical protein
MALSVFDFAYPEYLAKDLEDIGKLRVYTQQIDYALGYPVFEEKTLELHECLEEDVTTLKRKAPKPYSGFLCLTKGEKIDFVGGEFSIFKKTLKIEFAKC